jgi:hypothetical protein
MSNDSSQFRSLLNVLQGELKMLIENNVYYVVCSYKMHDCVRLLLGFHFEIFMLEYEWSFDKKHI